MSTYVTIYVPIYNTHTYQLTYFAYKNHILTVPDNPIAYYATDPHILYTSTLLIATLYVHQRHHLEHSEY
jgi:hypothetical protein